MERWIKRLQFMLGIFVKITTGVIVVTAVYISVFWGIKVDVKVVLLWQILCVSALCTVGSILLPASEEDAQEISKKGMLIRMIVYFILVNIVVLGCGFCFQWFSPSDWKMVLGMEISIIGVFAAVTAASYFDDYRIAEKMNRRLKEREKRDSE